MKIEVSTGEIFDKVTILEIKLMRINFNNETKLKNIKNEYQKLKFIYDITEYHTNDELHELVTQLFNVNLKLWNIEDSIRLLEKNKDFGPLFIELARAVYITNDKRAELKRQINKLTNSELIEEKSYEQYV